MLRSAKLTVLSAARRLSLFDAGLDSRWRQNRLLIIGYHGLARADEHRWSPALFMPAPRLRARFELLKRSGCRVLPLDGALRQLRAGELPPRSVVLTFDDGWYDFFEAAAPLLREFQFPATVYLTTYYSEFNRPVFDPMCDYLVWKGMGRTLGLNGMDLRLDQATRPFAVEAIKRHALENRLSGAAKDDLLRRVADQLDIDYDALCRARTLHLMTSDEVRAVAAAGIDVQLHTHRHRVSRSRSLFLREVDDNRRRIAAVAGRIPEHFCYPGGVHFPELAGWLEAAGVLSAVTCETALATRRSPSYRLPRLIDTSALTDLEFEAWISGLAAVLPHRPHRTTEGQVLEETLPAQTVTD
jgi:peptidoglycan/xylan/chitin deacetylase (PgdA/CDA1 family)